MLVECNSIERHHRLSSALCNAFVKSIAQVRRERLAQLHEEFGSYVKISELLGRSKRDATLSQIANEAAISKSGRARRMGDDQARAIEKACNKPEFWMDRDPDFERLISQPATLRVESGDDSLERYASLGGLSSRERDAVLALRALSQKEREVFVDRLMQAAEDAKHFTAEILAREKVAQPTGQSYPGENLPVRPDGEQDDTKPGLL